MLILILGPFLGFEGNILRRIIIKQGQVAQFRRVCKKRALPKQWKINCATTNSISFLVWFVSAPLHFNLVRGFRRILYTKLDGDIDWQDPFASFLFFLFFVRAQKKTISFEVCKKYN